MSSLNKARKVDLLNLCDAFGLDIPQLKKINDLIKNSLKLKSQISKQITAIK